MRKEYSRFVRSDIDSAAKSIAVDSPSRAVDFVVEVERQFRFIAKNPLLYQLRPEIGEGVRLVSVGRHVILYRVIGKVVRIERVAFGGRDLPNLL